jgi:hypothetical protein
VLIKKAIAIVFFSICSSNLSVLAQQPHVKPLEQLINKVDPGWVLVLKQIRAGRNEIEILPRDSLRANTELLAAQITTRSQLGAVIYETGGILIDHGWLRILGSGCFKMDRGLMEWNVAKTILADRKTMGYLLVADDILGGFFAINGGGLSKEEIGKIFYFAPTTLKWESTQLGYADFLDFCFSGNLELYYKDMRWINWQKQVMLLKGTEAISFYPFLFTKEGKDNNKNIKKVVSINELWTFEMDAKKQLEN